MHIYVYFVTVDMHLVMTLHDPPLCNVTGLAQFGGHIYVLCGWHHEHMRHVVKSIRVYEDGNTLDLLWLILVDEIESPFDIIEDENSNCLYVSEKMQDCIWKISLDDQIAVKWLCHAGQLIRQPTVKDGRLFVMIWGNPCDRLDIYGTDAVLIDSLPFSSDIKFPTSVIQISSDQFIVSHYLSDGDKELCAISHLTRDSRVIRQFNPKNESKNLLWPCLLSLDSDNRRLFVIDSENFNVVLIDSDSLSWIKIILTKESDYVPWGYLHDRRKNQFIMSEYNTLYFYKIVNGK